MLTVWFATDEGHQDSQSFECESDAIAEYDWLTFKRAVVHATITRDGVLLDSYTRGN